MLTLEKDEETKRKSCSFSVSTTDTKKLVFTPVWNLRIYDISIGRLPLSAAYWKDKDSSTFLILWSIFACPRETASTARARPRTARMNFSAIVYCLRLNKIIFVIK